MTTVCRLTLYLLSIACAMYSCSNADASDAMSREALTTLLRHRERVVRSVQCRFSIRRAATPEGAISLIRGVCRDSGREEDAANYIISTEIARGLGRDVQWWRQGFKERAEASIANKPPKITVFNGEDVRTLSDGQDRPVGTLRAPQEWYSVNRIHPLSFLFEFQNKPYSDLISDSRQCEISLVFRDARPLTRVSFQHPEFAFRSFTLLFDENDRLIERDFVAKLSTDREPRVYETHRFSDYRRHSDSSGEQIWFPHHATYHYYVGDLQDGTHVEYSKEDISIQEIAFNVPVDPQKFVLEFPEDARVYDGLHGSGWSDETDEQLQCATEFRTPDNTRRWFVAGGLVLLILATGVFLWKRKQKRVT